ncbi:hypothetical protein NM688_g5320 [Phlebia brevispora]|uniref:Uncharacterized protein n=1 Tax=Phlebia brevispora TaxID=194682 RepID=A0ACC1SXJ7_9APHY|nr:hypothetical protein NM688_g5320 [Phlebia brevispora]
MRVEEGFQPVPYTEGNPYTSDPVLPSLLKRVLPSHVWPEVHTELGRLGEELVTNIRELSAKVEEPRLVQYDHWGRRIDELQTSEGWRGLKAKMQQEGIPGIFYERRYQEHSRVFGFMKCLLASGTTHVVNILSAEYDGRFCSSDRDDW